MKPSINTHIDELEFLKQQGFAINPFNTYSNALEDIWEIKEKLEKDRDNLQYGIDGMVVKVNNLTVAQSAGVVGKTPRAHCAIKFAAEESTTTLTDMVWQVGRTGKVTPVCEFEPTELAGTTVKRATLHNYKEFIESNLHKHDTLVIRKAGDIIPEVISILDNLRHTKAQKFTHPNNCPECNTVLKVSKSSVDLECPNTETCPAQVLGRLSYFSQRSIANIVGLSEKQIEKFIELFGVTDIYDLYDLPYEKIQALEGFGEKSVHNLEQAIQAASTIEAKKFLAGMSIEGVGVEVAKLIVQKIKSDES
jgi:DNA ligase (NAD+)